MSISTPLRRRPAAGSAQRCFLGIFLLAASAAAQAQGGPPMVTDDPDTPGNGNWEINLASIAQRSPNGWLFTLPDADINYGWGDRLQLKVDTPWNARRQDGAWTTGSGTTLFGVKWRFFDDEETGWAVSTYPQLGLNLHSATVSRGLADPGRSVFLPVEATTHVGPVDIDVEGGRDLQQVGGGQWVAGVIVAHTFSGGIQMMFETREHWSSASSALLLNLGGRYELGGGLTLLAAAGREVGASPERLGALAYIGIQIRR